MLALCPSLPLSCCSFFEMRSLCCIRQDEPDLPNYRDFHVGKRGSLEVCQDRSVREFTRHILIHGSFKFCVLFMLLN